MKWIQAGLIASLIFSGCEHEQPRCCQTQTPAPPQFYAVAPPPPVIPEPLNNPALTRGEPPPKRAAFIDATAQPFFAHAEDYSWVQGQAEYSRLSKAWRLRYASVDEVDRYGGSVTLIENDLVQKLKDGQYVRVQGQITTDYDIVPVGQTSGAGELKKISPLYRVDSVRPIQSDSNRDVEPQP
jgi:hypothetical protein